MANNLIQIKRTSVPGRAANTTTLQNPGELALNMADGILYSTNGSFVFEVGANNTNVRVSNTLTISKLSANGSLGSNGQVLVSDSAGTYWASRYSVGSLPPALPNYGDVWYYTADDKLYMWVSDSVSDFWYDFLPPTF